MPAAKKAAAEPAAEVVTTDDFAVEETKSDDVKYVTVKSPFDGAKTSVPEDIVDALLASGYKK